MLTNKVYSGIGSRSSPETVCQTCEKISSYLANLGWILRSGGAGGCDAAFERGCDSVKGAKEIYLPSRTFFGNQSPLYNISSEVLALAAYYHPKWNQLSPIGKKLMARNSYQVLGPDLNSPSAFVVCWTPDGADTGSKTTIHTGGTGQAIRIASDYNIPIFNLAVPRREEQLFDFILNGGYDILSY